MNENQTPQGTATTEIKTKFCKHCAEKIDIECIICPKCGKQVEELKMNTSEQPKIEVNVSQNQSSVNTNTNTNMMNPAMFKTPKNKWVAVLLCLFLGLLGGHKFYEGKAGMGILYIFTLGLFGIGVLIDFIVLLCKPNPYYV